MELGVEVFRCHGCSGYSRDQSIALFSSARASATMWRKNFEGSRGPDAWDDVGLASCPLGSGLLVELRLFYGQVFLPFPLFASSLRCVCVVHSLSLSGSSCPVSGKTHIG